MKKVSLNNDNKKLIVLVVCIVVIVLLAVIMFIKNSIIKDDKKQISEKEVKQILTDEKVQIIYIENSNKRKCRNCETIKNYLDKKKINYTVFDEAKHSEEEYDKLLQTLSINKSDFGYPAIVYLSNGIMYANMINVSDISLVDNFIEDYKLDQVGKETTKKESVK